MLTLQDKNIIITGASSGIGRECAIIASKIGARVILIARNKEKLDTTLSSMSGKGHIVLANDVTDYENLKNILSEIIETDFKCINGIVHCAGREMTKPFFLTKAEHFRELLEVHLIAGLELIRFCSKKDYLPEEGASYVFISSIMAELGSTGLSSYCASKSAITSTVKALALELASKKVRINSVEPGCVTTDLLSKRFSKMSSEEVEVIKKQHPLGLGTPNQVANVVCFLLSDLSSWITGTNIVVDGGYSAH